MKKLKISTGRTTKNGKISLFPLKPETALAAFMSIKPEKIKLAGQKSGLKKLK